MNDLGLHPKGIKLGYCLSESEAFVELNKRRVVKSFGTFHQWLIGRRNPRPEILRETYRAYTEMVAEGQQPLAPSAIAQHIVQIEW